MMTRMVFPSITAWGPHIFVVCFCFSGRRYFKSDNIIGEVISGVDYFAMASKLQSQEMGWWYAQTNGCVMVYVGTFEQEQITN